MKETLISKVFLNNLITSRSIYSMGDIVIYVRLTCGCITLITCWFAPASENQLYAETEPTVR
jgi:hypothetical protein